MKHAKPENSAKLRFAHMANIVDRYVRPIADVVQHRRGIATWRIFGSEWIPAHFLQSLLHSLPDAWEGFYLFGLSSPRLSTLWQGPCQGWSEGE